MASKIDPTSDAPAELRRILHDQLEAALAASRDRRQHPTERIHRARTALKKARAALRLLRPLDDAFCRAEGRALARAARQLSALRDAAVMLETFDATLRHFAVPRKKFARLRAGLAGRQRARMPAMRALERRLRTFGARVGSVAKEISSWSPESTGFSPVADSFARTYRRARRAFGRVHTKPSAAAFHTWRKAVKACQSQCRFLQAAWPAGMKPFSRGLKTLGALLGDEHDLTVLRDTLRHRAPLRRPVSAGPEDPVTAVLALVLSRRDELRAEALPWGERLFADKPKAVKARLIRWWEAAQGG